MKKILFKSRKSYLLRLLAYVSKFLNVVLFPFFFLAIPFIKVFSYLGPRRLPWIRHLLKLTGVFIIPDHYYAPKFNYSNLLLPNLPRELPGLSLNLKQQLLFLDTLNYSEELLGLDLLNQNRDTLGFYFGNTSFEAGDAEFYYSMLRYFHPRNVIEIGCGHSTRIAMHAIQMNKSLDCDYKCNYICVEPYHRAWLDCLDVCVVRKKVECLDLSFFSSLRSGDLLFIDSSHMIRPEGDVLFELLHIVPMLSKGVIVHVHDIFIPYDYPTTWLVHDVRFWNEQYLLEALLSSTTSFSVLASLHLLSRQHFDRLSSVCPYLLRESCPGSFYFVVN